MLLLKTGFCNNKYCSSLSRKITVFFLVSNKTPRNCNYLSIDHFCSKFPTFSRCTFPLLLLHLPPHRTQVLIRFRWIIYNLFLLTLLAVCSTEHLQCVQWAPCDESLKHLKFSDTTAYVNKGFGCTRRHLASESAIFVLEFYCWWWYWDVCKWILCDNKRHMRNKCMSLLEAIVTAGLSTIVSCNCG